jgi:hypothetical protein
VIERTFDHEVGIIYVTGSGTCGKSAVDRHYAALRGMIVALRAQGLPIRVLSDVSTPQRQDPELERHILSHTERTFEAGDRIVVLAADIADKGHIRGLFGAADFGAFASRIPAEQCSCLASDRSLADRIRPSGDRATPPVK